MKRRILLLTMLLALMLTLPAQSEQGYERYRYYFFDTFDTVITFTAYTRDQSEFETYAALVESEMIRYHQIFDQYHGYQDVANLYAVNQGAGAAVAAEPALIELLKLVREWRDQYGIVLNPAMGSVLSLWHDAREDGTILPDENALAAASEHTDFDKVIIDDQAMTVRFDDPEITLDLGAVAKGYAAQLVADTLNERGVHSFIINAGGNVVCGDAPLDGREWWTVAVEDIDGVSTKELIGVLSASVVTSGDYQRYYEYEGQRYHHLIDPTTLFPAVHMHAVTVIHPDSALADFLSTTAFLLPYGDGRALIESIPGAEAMWTLQDQVIEMTDGFAELIARIEQ